MSETSTTVPVAASLRWSRDQLVEHQAVQLRRIAAHAYEHSPMYRRLWDEAGVGPGDIRDLDDVRRLPVVSKRQLADSQDARPPFGEHLAVPPETLVRTHVNTGPSKSSLQFDAVNAEDRQLATDIGELLFRIAGLTEADLVINTRQFGFTPAGLFMQEALEQLGCNTAPMSLGDNRRIVRSMLHLRPTAIESFTTQCVSLGLIARELGIDLAKELDIRRLFIGGEPGGGAPAVRAQLALLYGDPEILEYYGSAEVRLLAMECEAHDGMHLAEPFTLVEVLDPETFEPVEPGAEGVVLATSLYRSAMPMIRINTEDLTTLSTAPCSCGCNLARVGKILGKRGGIVRAGGKNQYPEPVIAAMRAFPEVERFRMLVMRESAAAEDRLVFEVEASGDLEGDRSEAIRQELLAVLNVEPGIVVDLRQVAAGTVPDSARFAPFEDRRKDVYAR